MKPDWNAISAIATALAVIVALATTLFQEWRVSRRAALQSRAVRDGALETLARAKIALVRVAGSFPGEGRVNLKLVSSMSPKLGRARRLIKLFVAREVDPEVLILLLQMDDLLADAERIVQQVFFAAQNSTPDNAPYRGELDHKVAAAERLIDHLS